MALFCCYICQQAPAIRAFMLHCCSLTMGLLRPIGKAHCPPGSWDCWVENKYKAYFCVSCYPIVCCICSKLCRILKCFFSKLKCKTQINNPAKFSLILYIISDICLKFFWRNYHFSFHLRFHSPNFMLLYNIHTCILYGSDSVRIILLQVLSKKDKN